MRLGLRAVDRAATNPGGDAGDKAPPRVRVVLLLLFASFVVLFIRQRLSRQVLPRDEEVSHVRDSWLRRQGAAVRRGP
ncbi:MAG: hypothetical protein LC740_01515, partial [Actinobacteria bacterium]|nr:hypothetical protein [Actinomycetota bacterium]